jgi:hypothetical protein
MPLVPDDFRDGDRVPVQDLNAILACLRELMTREGVTINRWVKTPSGGIVVGSYADCAVAARDPLTNTMFDGTATVRVFHLEGATQDIAGLRYIVVTWCSGQWIPAIDPC